MSLYTAKMAVLAARTAYRRHKLDPVLDPYSRAMLERHHYARGMIDFFEATAAHPDILVEADLDEQSVVVDVGAFVGEWSGRILERYDPDPARLRAQSGRPRRPARGRRPAPAVPRARLRPRPRTGTAQLALDGPGASTFTRESPFGSVPVEIRDVAAVFDELELDHIDLLKVNIEGGEYDLFDRLDECGWLPRVDLVSVQFHEWHPHAYRRRRSVRRALRRDHEQVWSYPWVWELWRRTSGGPATDERSARLVT